MTPAPALFLGFDPDKVQAKPKEFVKDFPGDASRLVARAEGYRYTVVNGQILLRDGGTDWSVSRTGTAELRAIKRAK